ncbi:uncharacterized protein LOC135962806 [Calliphora vicina]|uniref:uncharacterized protein LOC135962806 n=1 Tax=Calliphora vicina TaxID=7373 RepID=UPI00325B452A
MCVKAIELIINFRGEAGIADGNKYIFCKPSSSTLSKKYHRACPLLAKFSEECGAKIPESLRGTTLRKHIATYTSLLNVEEASVDRLANFMGHHKDIHKTIYRMSVPVAEITCVSKLLMAAVGDEDEMEDEYGDDENVEEEEEEGEVVVNDSIDKDNSEISLENSHTSKSSSSKKRRSTSPFGKTKRTRWNSEEKDAIYSIFGDLKDLERLPNLKECLKAIQTSSALKNRTPQQIKTWIDNQRRYKMD